MSIILFFFAVSVACIFAAVWVYETEIKNHAYLFTAAATVTTTC